MTRVWDSFLTDRDKEHVAIANKRKPVGWGSKPALLMIDNYQGVFSEPGVPLLEAIKSTPPPWETTPGRLSPTSRHFSSTPALRRSP